MRRILLLAALVGLALPGRAAAQGFEVFQGLFRQVNSFTISMHGGNLMGSSELEGNCGVLGLCGMGTEVFLNLHRSETLLLELALGTSYLQGFRAREETLDFRGAVRSVPTLSVYTTYLRDMGLGKVQPFVGLSFGLTELWNAQAYDPSGTRYTLRGNTYDQGVAAGLLLNIGTISGPFIETSYRSRKFFSLDWGFPSGVQSVPEGWPRELNLNTWLVSVGWQFDLKS
jgi:hypothetical protein